MLPPSWPCHPDLVVRGFCKAEVQLQVWVYTELGLRQEAGSPQLVLMEGTPACPTVLAQVKLCHFLTQRQSSWGGRAGWPLTLAVPTLQRKNRVFSSYQGYRAQHCSHRPGYCNVCSMSLGHFCFFRNWQIIPISSWRISENPAGLHHLRAVSKVNMHCHWNICRIKLLPKIPGRGSNHQGCM